MKPSQRSQRTPTSLRKPASIRTSSGLTPVPSSVMFFLPMMPTRFWSLGWAAWNSYENVWSELSPQLLQLVGAARLGSSR